MVCQKDGNWQIRLPRGLGTDRSQPVSLVLVFSCSNVQASGGIWNTVGEKALLCLLECVSQSKIKASVVQCSAHGLFDDRLVDRVADKSVAWQRVSFLFSPRRVIA